MPCLLIKGSGLVKTCRFRKERYVGDPINAVRIFNQKEVDELILFDIDATTGSVPPDFDQIESITSECFMPVCYGGGVKRMDDFRRLFHTGVEKVSVSSLLFEDPDVVREAVATYGSQSIIATIDVKRSGFRKRHRVFTHSARRKTAFGPVEAAKLAIELGVGEIVVNSIDRDGTWEGFDLELIRSVSDVADVPVVAAGGAGKLQDLRLAVDEGGASAAALGSMAVFQGKDLGVLIKFPTFDEVTRTLSGESP